MCRLHRLLRELFPGGRYRLAMSDWHFLVDRDDYRTTRVVQFAPASLDEGEVRLRVDAFGFTANNITYAAAGDMIGYWTFFPAPDPGDANRGFQPRARPRAVPILRSPLSSGEEWPPSAAASHPGRSGKN